jgi:hypothetical protein
MMLASLDVDDASGRAGAQQVEQQVGEEEVAEVVQREGVLQPVDGHPALRDHGTGVVDQDVQPVRGLLHLRGQAARGLLRGEVGAEQRQPPVPRALPDGVQRNLASTLVPAHAEHARTAGRQGEGGLEADSVVRPRDQGDLSSQAVVHSEQPSRPRGGRHRHQPSRIFTSAWRLRGPSNSQK